MKTMPSSRKHSNPFQLPESLQPHYKHSASLSESTLSASDDLQDTLYDEQDTKASRSRLYIPQACFSAEDISIHHAKGGQIQNAKTRIKKSFKNNRRRHKMKSIKFVVPSRKNMAQQIKKEQTMNKAVAAMDSLHLANILKQNKLIKHQSNAPPSLMRNIAKGVF